MFSSISSSLNILNFHAASSDSSDLMNQNHSNQNHNCLSHTNSSGHIPNLVNSKRSVSRSAHTRCSFSSMDFYRQIENIEQYLMYFTESTSQKEITIGAFNELLLSPYFVEESTMKSSNYHIMSGFLRILKSASLDPLSWLDMIAKRKGQETFHQLTFIEFEEEIYDLMKIMHQELFDHYHLQALFQYLTNRSDNNHHLSTNNTTPNNHNTLSGNNNVLKRYHVYAAWKKFTTKTSKIKSLNAAAKFLQKMSLTLTLTKSSISQLLPFLSRNTMIRIDELHVILETLLLKVKELELLVDQSSSSTSPTLGNMTNHALNPNITENGGGIFPVLPNNGNVSEETSGTDSKLSLGTSKSMDASLLLAEPNKKKNRASRYTINEDFARFLNDHERKALSRLVSCLEEGEHQQPLPNINQSGKHRQPSIKKSFGFDANDDYEITLASGRYFPVSEKKSNKVSAEPSPSSSNMTPSASTMKNNLNLSITINNRPMTEGLGRRKTSDQNLTPKNNNISPTNASLHSSNSRSPKYNDFLESNDFRLGYARTKLNKLW